MNTTRRIKVAITIILSVLLIFSLAACNNKDNKKLSKEKVEERTEKAYDAYKEVIKRNKKAIQGYSWQAVPGMSITDERGVDRPIALCDIDGDKVPELFFFAQKNEKQADLHIYTFNGKRAKELKYKIPGGKLSDFRGKWLNSFIIYKGKEPNTLYMHCITSENDFDERLYKYVMKNSRIRQSEVLITNTSMDRSGSGVVCTKNGKNVDIVECDDAFNKGFDDLDKAIIFSCGIEFDNRLIWQKFDYVNALCITYDEAMTELGN